MSKSIYDKAVKILNEYRNQNYNSTFRYAHELASAIDVILPNYIKQEKLLELYKKLITVKDKMIYSVFFDNDLDDISKIATDLENQIKELEK